MTASCETLEDALLDPQRAEEIRAAVDGEWMDADPAGAIVWDYTGGPS